MTRQATGNRMNAEADVFALGTQAAGQFADRLLCLCDRHAIAGHDDDAVGFVQRSGHTIGIDGDLFAFDGLCGTGCAAKSAQDDADKMPVHGLAHDIAEDRTGRADQSAHDDQKIIAKAEADCRRRPAGIAVQHRDNHRHVRAADTHDQVIADEQCRQCHQEQRQEPARPHVPQQAKHRDRRSRRIEHMPARQFRRRRRHLARQLAIGDDRTGKGDGTDKDTQEQFNPQDRLFDTIFFRQQRGKPVKRGLGRIIHRQHTAKLYVGVIADKYRRQADQRMHRGNQLWHLRHLHPVGQLHADEAAQSDQHDRQKPQSRTRPDQRGTNRQRHADDPVPDRALCTFLTRQPPQREDEEHRCDHIGRRCKSAFQRFSPCPSGFLEHGEHAPCHHETAKDIDPRHEHRQRRKDNHQRRTGSHLH